MASSAVFYRPWATRPFTKSLTSLGRFRFMAFLRWAVAHNTIFTRRPCGHTYAVVQALLLLYNRFRFIFALVAAVSYNSVRSRRYLNMEWFYELTDPRTAINGMVEVDRMYCFDFDKFGDAEWNAWLRSLAIFRIRSLPKTVVRGGSALPYRHHHTLWLRSNPLAGSFKACSPWMRGFPGISNWNRRLSSYRVKQADRQAGSDGYSFGDAASQNMVLR